MNLDIGNVMVMCDHRVCVTRRVAPEQRCVASARHRGSPKAEGGFVPANADSDALRLTAPGGVKESEMEEISWRAG